MSPGSEADLDGMLLAQTASNDYEELYRMDILGLEDSPSGDQNVVYAEFLEQRAVLKGGMRRACPGKEITLSYDRTSQAA